MKQFFKFMFATMAGIIVTFILFLIILAAILSPPKLFISDGSVLELKFENAIHERTNNDPLSGVDFSGIHTDKTPGLDVILKCISRAKDDSKIKGVMLNLSELSAGMATTEEIRNALLDFKKSGKFIYAYSESFSQKGYYLASVADKIFVEPTGNVDLRGLHINLAFFKGALDKLEIQPEIIRHGKFKSAVEPFMYDKMSNENREQISVFAGSIWNNILSGISESRKIDETRLREIADNAEARDAEQSLKLGLVDNISYYDEVLDDLKKKTGKGEKDKVNYVSLKTYSKVLKADDVTAKKIAIVYAYGDIVSGEGDEDQLGSDKVAGALRKARMDSTIKAIVFRVNSPGGSALASDVIWREAVLAKKAKPLIVSMGDYAASGGYYISCAADTIVARPNTITGSIGVFGLMFNTQNMFKNKLGVTFDTVKTGKYADLGTMSRPMSEGEKEIIQQEVERIYDTFISHVADGRKMSKADVDSIGQGRVWSGVDAKRLGLVDVLGGIDDAIAIAAAKANLKSYRTIALPEQKEFIQKLMDDISTEAKSSAIEKELGSQYGFYKQMKNLIQQKGIVARSPELEIY